MEVFGMAGLFGLILGFMFGVGCAAAVIYTVYMGGYRKALEDGLQQEKPKRYLENINKVHNKLSKSQPG
ncbi:hypothetical protein [Acidicapsa ligni]|uniref:hypothetical protein n=1 Tax=Acidicapsa ligni TaxID=542300 RepID=UPI0021E083F8|nr:hypothetical protein [Acidicapsa ligni]